MTSGGYSVSQRLSWVDSLLHRYTVARNTTEQLLDVFAIAFEQSCGIGVDAQIGDVTDRNLAGSKVSEIIQATVSACLEGCTHGQHRQTFIGNQMIESRPT